MTSADDMIEEIAMAINGPYMPLPDNSKYKLEELREIKWINMTTNAERRMRIAQATAVYETLKDRLK